jgi:phage repressor protein C with HTH and peptisase S24 domain
MIQAPSNVPDAVDFPLRVSSDSMEPHIQDGQIIWVKEHDILSDLIYAP